MIEYVIIGVLSVMCGVLGFLVYRLSKKLLEFDTLFDMLQLDVADNVAYFTKLLQTPLLNNSPEVIAMQKNIDVIGRRLQEFALRMDETTNKEKTPGE